MQDQNRRRFLLGTGTVVAGTVGLSSTGVFGASENQSIYFGEINAEEEYFVLKNTSESSIDVSGYIVRLEYANDSDTQKDTLPQDTVIPAGGSLTVASGDKDVASADVTLKFNGPQMNNDHDDVYALLTPSGDIVVRSDDNADVGVPETTTEEETTTESEETTTEETTTTTEEDTTPAEESTTTTESEETTTTSKETTTTTTTEESGSSSDKETTTESSEETTSSSSDSSSEKDDC